MRPLRLERSWGERVNLIEMTTGGRVLTIVGPTVNLNGSSKKDLNEDLAATISSIHQAQVDLRRCKPHGRDYYVQEDPTNAIHRATIEWERRMTALERVKDELFAIYEDVANQGKRS